MGKAARLVAGALVFALAAGASGAQAPGSPAGARLDTAVPDESTAGEGPGLYLVSAQDARREFLTVDQSESGNVPSGAAADNPALMLFASLAVPGSGQLIEGKARGYVYMLVEAALWGGFFALDQKGLDERSDYERFADEHWDADAYYAWYDTHCTSCDSCGYECRPLADYGTQEYYEDIGKYNAYWGWWNNDGQESYLEGYSETDLALRNLYYSMRGDSNRDLRRARYALMAALLNHVVSAFDAFMTARVGSPDDVGSGPDLNLEFDVADGGTGLTCAIVSRY